MTVIAYRRQSVVGRRKLPEEPYAASCAACNFLANLPSYLPVICDPKQETGRRGAQLCNRAHVSLRMALFPPIFRG